MCCLLVLRATALPGFMLLMTNNSAKHHILTIAESGACPWEKFGKNGQDNLSLPLSVIFSLSLLRQDSLLHSQNSGTEKF